MVCDCVSYDLIGYGFQAEPLERMTVVVFPTPDESREELSLLNKTQQ